MPTAPTKQKPPVKKAKAKAPVKTKAKAKPKAVPAKAKPVKGKAKTPAKPTAKKVPAKKPSTTKVKAPKKKAEAIQTAEVIVPVVARKMFSDESSSLIPVSTDLTPAERMVSVREFAKKTLQMGGCLELVQGEVLYEIKHKEYWKEWGYSDFKDYIEEEMEFKWRKGYYLVEMYDKFVVELGLSKEELIGIEWSKAKELVSVITAKNSKGLLKKLSKNSLKEIKKIVKRMKNKAAGIPEEDDDTEATSGEPQQRLNVVLKGGQIRNVEDAMAIAQQATGSEAGGNLLDLICTEFLAGKVDDLNVQAMTGVEDHIKNLERVYNCNIKLMKGKKK